MTSCAEYKNLVECYLDLDAGQKAALDAHLARCASCAEYKADADKTMCLLRELKRRLTVAVPVDQAFEKLSARIAASRRQVIWSLGLVALLVATPFAMLLRGGVPALALGLVAFAIVAAVGTVWAAQRDQAALVRLTPRPGAFYDTWRRDLEKRIRMTTGGAVLVSVWSIGFLFYSVLGPFGIVERTVVLSAAVLLGWGGLHTFFVELKQLKSKAARGAHGAGARRDRRLVARGRSGSARRSGRHGVVAAARGAAQAGVGARCRRAAQTEIVRFHQALCEIDTSYSRTPVARRSAQAHGVANTAHQSGSYTRRPHLAR